VLVPKELKRRAEAAQIISSQRHLSVGGASLVPPTAHGDPTAAAVAVAADDGPASATHDISRNAVRKLRHYGAVFFFIWCARMKALLTQGHGHRPLTRLGCTSVSHPP
jgi:hypothetical protein